MDSKKVFVHESVKGLQKAGLCVRPQRGAMALRIKASVDRLGDGPGSEVLDFITAAGAATHLRKLRAQDPEKYGDLGSGEVDGSPAVYLHGCWDIRNGGRKFIRQNKMKDVLPEVLLKAPELNLTVGQVLAVSARFGLKPWTKCHTMQEIAKFLNVSKSRVGQMLDGDKKHNLVGAMEHLGFVPRWRLE